MDRTEHDAPVVAGLNEAVARNGRWGFWLCYQWLRNQGYPWNHKRCWRVYCQMRLNLPRRAKRRLPAVVRQPLHPPSGANQIWALDFMQDAVWSGRAFRILTIMDESNREVLALEIDTSLPSAGKSTRSSSRPRTACGVTRPKCMRRCGGCVSGVSGSSPSRPVLI
jgi:putative transposase